MSGLGKTDLGERYSLHNPFTIINAKDTVLSITNIALCEQKSGSVCRIWFYLRYMEPAIFSNYFLSQFCNTWDQIMGMLLKDLSEVWT